MRAVESFNPRAHKGRDPGCAYRTPKNKCFNPRAHKGRDRVQHPRRIPRYRFNPRAHKGRDDPSTLLSNGTATFQSTRPQGARLGVLSCVYSDMRFQSTRPQGARRDPLAGASFKSLVSIHAPTRGATNLTILRPPNRSCFNPRAHKGRDPKERITITATTDVSIHAPTRGATKG